MTDFSSLIRIQTDVDRSSSTGRNLAAYMLALELGYTAQSQEL
jgi:hypothetical protein